MVKNQQAEETTHNNLPWEYSDFGASHHISMRCCLTHQEGCTAEQKRQRRKSHFKLRDSSQVTSCRCLVKTLRKVFSVCDERSIPYGIHDVKILWLDIGAVVEDGVVASSTICPSYFLDPEFLP